jgi:hypothetical protein
MASNANQKTCNQKIWFIGFGLQTNALDFGARRCRRLPLPPSTTTTSLLSSSFSSSSRLPFSSSRFAATILAIPELSLATFFRP